MRTSFDTVSIGEVAKVRSGYAFKSKDWTDSGVPVVKIANVKDGELVMDGCSFVSRSVADEAREWLLREGDILIAMTGYIGDVARVRGYADRLLNQRVGRFEVVANEACESDYLYYVLRSDEIKRDIKALGYGSAQPNVSPRLIQSVKIPLPRPDEQRAIASVLGALDDKIEQNRRTAQALEKLARAIFRAWFVDFEPVNAKAAGATSFPSMPQPVFDALPTRFVDSDIGPVPKGWEVKPLSQVCTLVSGGTPKRSESSYWGGDVPWYSVRDAPRDGNVWVTTTAENISEAGLANSVARLLPQGGTIISARGTVGKIAMAGTPMAFNQSCYGLLPTDEQAFGYLYQLVQSAVSELQQRTHGSVFDTITRATFDALTVVSPDGNVVPGFTEVAGKYFELMLALKKESSKLAELRDYLLPKLLSGQVRVRDAEREVASVA